MLKFLISIALLFSLFGIAIPENATAQNNLQVEILGFDVKSNTKIMVSVFAEKVFFKGTYPIQINKSNRRQSVAAF